MADGRGARRRPAAAWVVALGCLGAAAPASGEIAIFASGRTLSIQSHRLDGEQITLVLRQGGEITCPASLIARVVPDEVPYHAPASQASASRHGPSPPAALTGPYQELIEQAARRHGVDPNLVHAVIRAESNYEPRARSHKGARGLMQLMPATLRQYAVADPYDPAANIDAGTRHLRRLLSRFSLREALAAYNAGEGAVVTHGGVPPYAETRTYIDRVLGALPPPVTATR